MAETEVIDQIKEAVENLHGGTATLAQSVPVHKTFEEQTARRGEVYIFDLAGHPTATRAYAGRRRSRGARSDGSSRCYTSNGLLARRCSAYSPSGPWGVAPRNATMTPDLTDDDKAILSELLREAIERDGFPMGAGL
jgi:hypothetical protein